MWGGENMDSKKQYNCYFEMTLDIMGENGNR